MKGAAKKSLPKLTKSMSVTKCRRLVEEARKRYDDEIAEIAEQIRREHVEPLCREFDCEFISGMGTYFFRFNALLTIGFAWTEAEMARIPKKMQARLRTVLDMLDTDTDTNGCIGYAVGDVRKESGRK